MYIFRLIVFYFAARVTAFNDRISVDRIKLLILQIPTRSVDEGIMRFAYCAFPEKRALSTPRFAE